MATLDGQPVAWIGRRPLWVLRYVPGTEASWGTPSGLRAIGSTLGLAHRVLRDRGTPGEFPHHRWAHLQDPSYALGEAWVRPVLDAAIASMRAEEARIRPVQGVSFCGGPGILIDEDGTTGLVDIDELGWGSLAFDLGFFAWLADAEGAGWAELADAYLAVAPVPEADLELLPTYNRFSWAGYAWFHATRLTGHWVAGDRQADDRKMLERARKELARFG